jgi:hypothetical protein
MHRIINTGKLKIAAIGIIANAKRNEEFVSRIKEYKLYPNPSIILVNIQISAAIAVDDGLLFILID